MSKIPDIIEEKVNTLPVERIAPKDDDQIKMSLRIRELYGKKFSDIVRIKKSFKTTLIIFIFLIFFTIFLKPAIFIEPNDTGIIINNLSKRTISEIAIYRVDFDKALTEQLTTINSMAPMENQDIYTQKGLIIAYSLGTLPAVAIK